MVGSEVQLVEGAVSEFNELHIGQEKVQNTNGQSSTSQAPSQDDDEETQVDGLLEAGKKKKKKRTKKKKEPNTPNDPLPSAKAIVVQTVPPSIPIDELFPSGDFPMGEIQQYKDDNLWRSTSEEKREVERLEKPMYNAVRRAAEVHRQVRKYMRSLIKPGMLMIEMCETLENMVHRLIKENGLEAGIAFPTGCSLNWLTPTAPAFLSFAAILLFM